MPTTTSVNDLLTQAKQQPGVAEVMRIYGIAAAQSRPSKLQPVVKVISTTSTARAK